MASSTLGSILSNVGSASRPDDSISVNNNRKYKVLIDVRTDENINNAGAGGGNSIFPLEANLPERFHMELQSSWSMPFAQAGVGELANTLGGGMAQTVVEGAAAAAGVGTKFKGQHVQTWTDTSPLDINLDLIFYAQQSTDREIKQRQLALLKLCAPSTKAGGQVLIAPGPRLLGKSIADGVEGRRIDVYIGTYLTLRNCIIKSVGTDIVTLMDRNGNPIGMSLNIGISTWNAAITTEDLDEMFYGANSWPNS
jgi:hypothetical protein